MPQTAFGPLVEPGWPSSLPGPPDLGKIFLNAAYLGSEMSRKKQQLENQLQLYALKAQQSEGQMALQEQKFGLAQQAMDLRHEKDVQDIEKTRDAMQRGWESLGLREQQLDINKSREDRIAEHQKKIADGALGALQTQGEMGGKDPLDPGYVTDYYSTLIKNTGGNLPPATVNSILRNVKNDRNQKLAQAEKANADELKYFQERVGSELYGNPKITNPDPYLHPEKYGDEPKPQTWSDWFQGAPRQTTGNKLIPIRDPSTGKVIDTRKASVDDLTRYNKEYRDIVARGQKLPRQEADPSLGVYPVNDLPRNDYERALRWRNDATADPKVRAAATRYLEQHPVPPPGTRQLPAEPPREILPQQEEEPPDSGETNY
jgi:hypothetical protein